MDRFDSRLSRQRGPGRVLLVWLHLWIPAILVGFGLWSMLGPGTPGPGLALLEIVAWSALAAVPLTGLVIYLRRTRAGTAGKQFSFSWRALASMLLFLAAAGVNILTDQQADWPRVHRVIGLVTLLLTIAGGTFALMAASRYRRGGSHLLDDSQSR